ncbi:hypothetical protein GLW07_13855 [Bacillus hwajinpoensis]|uniref:Uncharacterized protein n=1 Tax=Guptibacillus hwajinpoensis TaxID=208199 RepID=A0A845F142_9BACL|nr:hypothetical protein [Pseudalkalibacillus hwajinpoensis]MYL64437.1 hypothetical protein [Pseudalkalibacillus hwajinpoensis]
MAKKFGLFVLFLVATVVILWIGIADYQEDGSYYRLMKGVIAIVVIGLALILVPTNHKNRSG